MPEPVAVAVFAKAPIPGLAKTRMIPRLGADGAAELHRRLLHRTLTTAAEANVGPLSLWCTPSCEHSEFAACRKTFGLALFRQLGNDLGEVMLQGFSHVCEQGPALLIGTDCPALTVSTLRRAADALLSGRDGVFVPAEDGGYVLIGLRKPQPALFEAMPWGTEQVMAETRRRLRQLGLDWDELETLWDVDRPEDLTRLAASGLLDAASEETPL